jgi:hypothetical protein
MRDGPAKPAESASAGARCKPGQSEENGRHQRWIRQLERKLDEGFDEEERAAKREQRAERGAPPRDGRAAMNLARERNEQSEQEQRNGDPLFGDETQIVVVRRAEEDELARLRAFRQRVGMNAYRSSRRRRPPGSRGSA